MKKCPRCKIDKELKEFNSQKKYCKLCHKLNNDEWRRENINKNRKCQIKYQRKRIRTSKERKRQQKYAREHYRKNKKKYLEKNRRTKKRKSDSKIIFLLNYFKTHPCVDCGETNPLLLTFDHIAERGKKSFNISRDICFRNFTVIEKEIEKCEIRCANCHLFKTKKERQYDIYKYLEKINSPYLNRICTWKPNN